MDRKKSLGAKTVRVLAAKKRALEVGAGWVEGSLFPRMVRNWSGM